MKVELGYETSCEVRKLDAVTSAATASGVNSEEAFGLEISFKMEKPGIVARVLNRHLSHKKMTNGRRAWGKINIRNSVGAVESQYLNARHDTLMIVQDSIE